MILIMIMVMYYKNFFQKIKEKMRSEKSTS